MEDEFKELELEAEVIEGGLVLRLDNKTSHIVLCGQEIWWLMEKMHELHQRVIGDF
jgi:hypothetical protein